MNYTQVETMYGDTYNLAPRFHALGNGYEETWQEQTSAQLLGTYGCIYFIDLAQEEKIGVGIDWPYPDLAAGECVVT